MPEVPGTPLEWCGIHCWIIGVVFFGAVFLDASGFFFFVLFSTGTASRLAPKSC